MLSSRDVTNTSEPSQSSSKEKLKHSSGQFVVLAPGCTTFQSPAPSLTSTHLLMSFTTCITTHAQRCPSQPPPLILFSDQGKSRFGWVPAALTGPAPREGRAVPAAEREADPALPAGLRCPGGLASSPADSRPPWLAAAAPCAASSPPRSRRLGPFIATDAAPSSSAKGKGSRPLCRGRCPGCLTNRFPGRQHPQPGQTHPCGHSCAARRCCRDTAARRGRAVEQL